MSTKAFIDQLQSSAAQTRNRTFDAGGTQQVKIYVGACVESTSREIERTHQAVMDELGKHDHVMASGFVGYTTNNPNDVLKDCLNLCANADLGIFITGDASTNLGIEIGVRAKLGLSSIIYYEYDDKVPIMVRGLPGLFHNTVLQQFWGADNLVQQVREICNRHRPTFG